eukprot:365401-Chlamydomonas_euryale.AAC.4
MHQFTSPNTAAGVHPVQWLGGACTGLQILDAALELPDNRRLLSRSNLTSSYCIDAGHITR